jgi:UDP:flavonoid glycosyltransferase YjiC (YdhE family)
MDRYDWTDEELARKLKACLEDPAMKYNLVSTATHMQNADGPEKAASIIEELALGAGSGKDATA